MKRLFLDFTKIWSFYLVVSPLESEGNQDAVDDKFNRVDIKARDANGSHRQESKVHGAKNRRDHESHRVFLKQK